MEDSSFALLIYVHIHVRVWISPKHVRQMFKLKYKDDISLHAFTGPGPEYCIQLCRVNADRVKSNFSSRHLWEPEGRERGATLFNINSRMFKDATSNGILFVLLIVLLRNVEEILLTITVQCTLRILEFVNL